MSGDVWSKPKRRFVFTGEKKSDSIESNLEILFQGGHPVLFASARAAMSQVIHLFFIGETVRIFPYASQCVVNAINFAGKSASTALPGHKKDISYNQWGTQGLQETDLFIRDSADSLYSIGGIVCQSNSRFEVWSFPKIIGTTFGAVMWCREESDALILRAIRDNSSSQNIFIELFLALFKGRSSFFYSRWENFQFANPRLNSIQLRELSRGIHSWERIYKERLSCYVQNFVYSRNSSPQEAQQSVFLNRGVIPAVIEGEHFIKATPLRSLHKILADGRTCKVSVFAYQSKIRTN